MWLVETCEKGGFSLSFTLGQENTSLKLNKFALICFFIFIVDQFKVWFADTYLARVALFLGDAMAYEVPVNPEGSNLLKTKFKNQNSKFQNLN